jgi:glycosyltransferase involved in cell wall biosynthesis
MTRIAFYAPLKPADHRVASGDRTMARLFLAALERAGFEPHVASRLRAWIARPDPRIMERMRERGEAEAGEMIRFWRRLTPKQRPAAWFTYHVYYKAVDWIGPKVSKALSIPYVIAEASHAPKRARGAWAINHAGAQAAIASAASILCLNPADKECLREIVPANRLIEFPPFLEVSPLAPMAREEARRILAERHDLDMNARWLLAVGMMREGDKLASYRVLGEALKSLRPRAATLIVVGDGPAKAEVKRALSQASVPVVYAGFLTRRQLPTYYSASNLLVWPAVNEAFGMALLEAQAHALPVVAGASGGVPAIVEEGVAGFLAAPGDSAAFAAALSRALSSDLGVMGQAARRNALKRHGFDRAALRLKSVFARVGVRP